MDKDFQNSIYKKCSLLGDFWVWNLHVPKNNTPVCHFSLKEGVLKNRRVDIYLINSLNDLWGKFGKKSVSNSFRKLRIGWPFS